MAAWQSTTAQPTTAQPTTAGADDRRSRAEPLRVVVTNDDGIDSAGLRLLAAAALRTGCKVLVATPASALRIRTGRRHVVKAAEGRLRVTMSEHEARPADGPIRRCWPPAMRA